MSEMEVFVSRTLSLIQETKPPLVVVLGDVLDTHSKIDQIPAKLAVEWLGKIAKLSRLVLLIGNHDRVNDEDFLTDQHPFTALKQWDNTLVVDSGRPVPVEGFRLYAMPYVPCGRFEEGLRESFRRNGMPDDLFEETLKQTHLLLAHQEFRGAKMGAFVSEKGDVWPLDAPLVVSGHIHDAQTPQPNVRYIGTPLQHAFGDTRDKTVSFFVLKRERGVETCLESRVDLGFKKRLAITTSAADFLTTDPRVDPEKTIFVWHIAGTRAEVVALRHTDKYKLWKPWIVEKVLPDAPLQQMLPSDTGSDPTPLESFEGKTYMQILKEQVLHSENPGLRSAFESVFVV